MPDPKTPSATADANTTPAHLANAIADFESLREKLTIGTDPLVIALLAVLAFLHRDAKTPAPAAG